MTRPIPNLNSDWLQAPKLYDEVEWGPHPSSQDYRQAYDAWKLPYNTLRPHAVLDKPPAEVRQLNDKTRAVWEQEVDGLRSPLEILVAHIHHHFRKQSKDVPPPSEHAQEPPPSATGASGGWKAEEFLDLVEPEGDPTADLYLEGRKFTVARKEVLQRECVRRGLSDVGRVADLRARIVEHANLPEPREDCRNLFPRSRLSRWGLHRYEQYRIPYRNERVYAPLEMYTIALHLSPYNPAYWVARAFLFFQQGHYDLAAGDAYRAQYLVQIIGDVHCRAKRPGLHPRIWDAVEQHVVIAARDDPAIRHQLTKDQGVPYFTMAVRKVATHVLTLSLRACDDLYHAVQSDTAMIGRCLMPSNDRTLFTERREQLSKHQQRQQQKREDELNRDNFGWPYVRAGTLRPRPYPADDPIDRTAPSILDRLNREYVQRWSGDGEGADAYLRVEAGDDGVSLRVVANRDIAAHELIYADEPNVRGHLQPLREVGVTDREQRTDAQRPKRVSVRDHGLQRFSCENCSREVSVEAVNAARTRFVRALRADRAAGGGGNDARHVAQLRDACACLFADPLLCFCPAPDDPVPDADPTADPDPTGGTASTGGGTKRKRARAGGVGARKRPKTAATTATTAATTATTAPAPEPATRHLSCLEIARRHFHHRVCGKNWRWLHEALQRVDRDLGHQVVRPSNYKHGTMLSLLLREVFDMTLQARADSALNEPHLLAHEIDALLPLSAEEFNEQHRFPFSYVGNIVVPFDLLESLGVNIFRDLDFDTWVIQLVLRKLIVYATPSPMPPWATRRQWTELAHLYLMTGFGLFNHACRNAMNLNATWSWDRGPSTAGHVPNRILVRTVEAIPVGTEIRLQYHNARQSERDREAQRYLGRPCDCDLCKPMSVQEDDLEEEQNLEEEEGPEEEEGQEEEQDQEEEQQEEEEEQNLEEEGAEGEQQEEEEEQNLEEEGVEGEQQQEEEEQDQ